MSNLEFQATKYIKEALESFIVLFPQTQVSYQFDFEANVHCVEIVPNQVYHSNSDYISWENQITNSFIGSFPNQNICFITDDAIIGLDNIQFKLVGSQYFDTISTNSDIAVITSECLKISTSNISTNIDEISTSDEVFKNGIINGITNSITNSNMDSLVANSIPSIKNQNQDLISTNFPMAA